MSIKQVGLKMNKKSYVISGLIILGIIYSLAIGPGGGPGGAIQSGMGRIGVLTDDWPIYSDASFEITNELTSITEGDMQWNRTYGGAERDEATALIQTTDGGFALAGYTSSYGTGGEDFYLVKTDVHGTMEWQQTYGGSGDEAATAVIQTTDGGFALAGRTTSYGTGRMDFWLVRTDAHGTMEWQQTYGGSGSEIAWAVIQTADGGFALAGFTRSYGAGGNDFWLVKTDAHGTMEWQQTYGGAGYDVAYAVIQTADGGFALAGYIKSYGAGGNDFWLVKTDAHGIMEWQQTYGGSDSDVASAVIQTADGGFALAGRTYSYGAGTKDFWLVKTDAHGIMEWHRPYGGADWDRASSVIQTGDGGFALAGDTDSFGAGNADAWLVKTDAHGTMEWQQTYGGAGSDEASAVIQTADGGFALAGYTGSSGAGEVDFWLVKIIPPETIPPTLSTTTVTVVSPNGGEVWYDIQTITWTATNLQGDPLTYTVFYSPNGGQTWIQLATGLAELSFLWDTTTVEDGTSYLIKVEASDGTHTGVDISNGPFEIVNAPTTGGDMQWQQTYGGAEGDEAYAVIQTTDGGFAFAGYTSSYGAGGADVWLVKTDAHGTMEWQQTYGGAEYEWARAGIQTMDGGFALAGWTESFGAGWYDFYLVKTDAHGKMEWKQTYGGAGEESARAVIQTADGGFALAGFTTSTGAGGRDGWLVKTDAHGTVEWQQTYGGAEGDEAYAVIQTADGGFALAGVTSSFGTGDPDIWLVKANARGELLWTRTYGGSENDVAISAIQTTDGGFTLAGYTMSFGTGDPDIWLVKTDTHGNMDWQRTYGGVGYDVAWAMIQTADGGFALAGKTGGKTAVIYLSGDFWLVKTDAHGTVEWQQTYGGAEGNQAYAVIQTADGGFALTGVTESYGAGGRDAWLVKTIPPETTPPELSATTSTTTGTVTDTATTDTPAAFIPGFTLVELVLALACLVVLTRRKTKQ